MRLSIRFNNKWIVVPCGGGENSVEWLIEETLQRINDKTHAPQNYEAVLVQSGGKLERTDCIKEVLKDSDFVHILGESNNYFVFLAVHSQETTKFLPEINCARNSHYGSGEVYSSAFKLF